MADRVAGLVSWLRDFGGPGSVGTNEAADALERAQRLIRDLTDPDPCWFDHHGGCQAHGYLSLEPGEVCPHAEAKRDWIDEVS